MINPPTFLRDFAEKAAMLGFEFVGYARTGHPRFHNADVGATITTASTPSDWRSMTNSLVKMERISGRKLPRDKSGHHSFKPVRRALDTRLSDAEEKSLERITELLGEAELLKSRWDQLISGRADRTAALEARKILDSYEKVRRELSSLHRLIPPLAAA